MTTCWLAAPVIPARLLADSRLAELAWLWATAAKMPAAISANGNSQRKRRNADALASNMPCRPVYRAIRASGSPSNGWS